MTDFILSDRPSGISGNQSIPTAPLTEGLTSTDVVPDTETDAFYFRALEQRGTALNEPQVEAVRHYTGPLLTLAGAGSGKTSVLVSRTGYLIRVRGIDPRNILLVTFTQKAAAEMKERIAMLPGLSPRAANSVQARTFHSFFLTILKHQGYTHRLLGEPRVQQMIMKRILREMGLQAAYEPETILALLSSYKMNGLRLQDLPESSIEERDAKTAMLRYEAWKQDTRQMDFDDVLVFAYELLQRETSLLAALQRRFQFVMADEFQDTNALQYALLQMIVKPHRNLMVVGDDDQTIYTFNGARHTFILNFDTTYPEARTITLDINYRSNAAIVGLGNAVITHNTERREKSLKIPKQLAPMQNKASTLSPQYWRPANPDEEAEQVVRHIMEQVRSGKRQYREIAVLHRTASSSRAVFEQLIMLGLPFVQFGTGQVFYQQWLVKPLIDHLRLALNPRQHSALEGAVTALYIPREQGLSHIMQQEKQRPKKYPLIHLQDWPGLKSYQRDQIKERIRLIKSLQAMKPIFAIQEMRRQFYEKFVEVNDLHRLTQHKETLKETLDELESAAKRFDSVQDFVSFVDDMIAKHQEIEQLKQDTAADALTLMTIHRAKGLEFPCVYLIGASEGILPHSSALQADQMDSIETAAEIGEWPLLGLDDNSGEMALSHTFEVGVAAEKLEAGTIKGANDSEAAASSHAEMHTMKPCADQAAQRADAQVQTAQEEAASTAADAKTLHATGAASAAAAASKADAALEEERRLAYVAVTRAQEELYISSPAHYRGKKAELSRFFAAAFGGATASRRTPPPARRTAVRAGADHAAAAGAAAEQSVRAWVCTDAPRCPAWMRMSAGEAVSASGKPCPMCGAPMAPGERIVKNAP